MPSQMQKEHNRKVSSIPTQLQEAGFAVRLGFLYFLQFPLALFVIFPWGLGSTTPLHLSHCRLRS